MGYNPGGGVLTIQDESTRVKGGRMVNFFEGRMVNFFELSS